MRKTSGESAVLSLQMPTRLSKLSPSKRRAIIASTIFQTKRISQHGKNGDIKEAIAIFSRMRHANQVTYNAMLSVLLNSDHLDYALHLFDTMPKKNPTSFSSIITGLSRSNSVSKARQIFDSVGTNKHNVFSWTSMISCYVQNGMPFHALNLFRNHYRSFYQLGILPNSHTFSILLKACGLTRSLHVTRQIHGLICTFLSEEDSDTMFVWNTMIDIYAKLGQLVDAEIIFSRMKYKDLATLDTMMNAYTFHLLIDKALDIFRSMGKKDILSWNIVISGLAECQRGKEGILLFGHLVTLDDDDDVKPNASTYTIVFSLCATLAEAEFGRQVHTKTVKNGLYGYNTCLSNSIITMYANFGMTDEPETVFNEIYIKDVVSWNSVIQGLGQNGCASRALEIADVALSLNNFNHNTFIAILTSCSHGGFVMEGLRYLNSMKEKHDLEPNCDHYICAIDLLGRSGRLQEAHEYLHHKGLNSNSIAWATLLNACFIHGNREMGEVAANNLKLLEPGNRRSYLSLAKVYVSNNKVEDLGRIHDILRNKDSKKSPGYSWLIQK